ncbi:hypothetical protein SH668x_000620 [Planctomicrobium sp. SH668]|uniref:hypothetical protein n=1 Tax=Planctomicrobium sp. SH668 TaxID=3448126 RepID=UPI003F5B7127
MLRFGLTLALALCVSAPVVAADGWGSLEGQVILDGKVPEVPVLAKNAKGCPPGEIPDETKVFDPATGGIGNIIVYVTKKPSKIHPDYATSTPEEIVFDQNNCQFIPHCLIVQTHQSVKCISSDSVSHNLHSNPFSNKAENFIVQPNDQVGKIVKMPLVEKNPVKIQCDIHPMMTAIWLVVDHPYAAITDKEGKFKIENLPEGEHEIRIWGEKPGNIERKLTVKIKAGETTKLPVNKVKLSAFEK